MHAPDCTGCLSHSTLVSIEHCSDKSGSKTLSIQSHTTQCCAALLLSLYSLSYCSACCYINSLLLCECYCSSSSSSATTSCER
eukprot:4928-Heterococcus_DN1.PRE.2